MSELSGVIARPPSYAQMLVDSKDRYPRGYPESQQAITSSANWRLNNQNSALYGYFTRLAVTQAQLLYNTPTIVAAGSGNISDQANNVFYISQSFTPGPNVVPIAPFLPVTISTTLGGWFDYQELAEAIETALTGVGTGAFTVTYNQAQSGGFIIRNDTTNFAIVSPSDLLAAGVITAKQETSVARCLTTLGFINNIGARSEQTIAPFAVLGGTPTMLYTSYIDIVSRYLTKYQRVKDFTTLKNPTKTSILMRVYMTPPNNVSRPIQTVTDNAGEIKLTIQSPFSQPYTICVDPNQPKFITWSPDEAIANFDLQLLDDLGIELPISRTNLQYGGQTEYQLTIFASES
jgi:hypothetical protein